MSPTLLELVVAVLLLGLAWYIAVKIAPELIVLLLDYWRGPKPPPNHPPWPPEKNITPPNKMGAIPPAKHDPHHK